ncbi:S8 family serine peptidase [Actinoplanes sp. NPDC026619]|uniref:S8 family serine peptidase n=1 Tax=Actinoplanes sp. NPDC026619 TaxID=3155798 RepID=UPI0033D9DA5F
MIRLLLVAALAAAPATPPTLPTPADGCVPPSPVTSTDTPPPLKLLAPREIWPVTRGAGVVVAVVDTGVSATAPDLRGAVRPGTDITGGRGDRDCRGRGTALAGIVAARPRGNAGFTGMAPAATVLPIRVTDADGKLTGDRIAAGIRAAASAGAGVILVATGVTTPNGALADAVRFAVSHDALVVASAADSGSGSAAAEPPVAYPAAYPEVLAVSAAGATPAPAAAGVDLAAPADGAFSIAPSGSGHYGVEGAGVAAAYVAGAAALVRSYWPSLTAAQVRDRLETTARPAPGGPGTLDAYAAVTALAPRGAAAAALAPAAPIVVAVPAGVSRPARTSLLTAGGAAVALLAFALAAAARRRRTPM